MPVAQKSGFPVAVIGNGSWATALIKIMLENKLTVHWWMRSKDDADFIKTQGHNRKYLVDVSIPRSKVKVFNDPQACVKEAGAVVFAVPAAFIKPVLDQLQVGDLRHKIIISAVKGIIPEEGLLLTDYIEHHFLIQKDQMAVIGGPCHAEEVALEKLSYLTIAGWEQNTMKLAARLLTCSYIRTTATSDVYGVEYFAVMKNIVALACGIAHGLGFGDNFQAVMVSNAMQEINAFVKQVSPMQHRDVLQSAYLGDLLVTSYSQFSRNRTFGNLIGRGYSVQAVKAEMNMVAEGYYAAKSIFLITRDMEVALPIARAVYRILYEQASASAEFQQLKLKFS